MVVTVRTIITNDDDVDTAVKYYYSYELAKTQLMMQRDLLILELLMKYQKGLNLKDLEDFELEEYGELKYENDVLEFKDKAGEYHIRYEIKIPENLKEDYLYQEMQLNLK
jgi:hypothetical protein